jgi:hypothetical protein
VALKKINMAITDEELGTTDIKKTTDKTGSACLYRDFVHVPKHPY